MYEIFSKNLSSFYRFKSYSFGYIGPHAEFQNHIFSPSSVFLVKSDPPKCTIVGVNGGIKFQFPMQSLKIVFFSRLG